MDPISCRSGVVVRDSLIKDFDDVVRAVLSATDHGFLLTDLNHIAIACNESFGAQFGVDIQGVVRNDVESVRAMVRDRIEDPEAWEKNLIEVYGNPMGTQIDELILHQPTVRLRRYTGPVVSKEGTAIGRIWTFLDVTSEARQKKIREALAEASIFFDSQPRRVYEYLVDLLSDHYGSLVLLSVRYGDFMRFQAVGGPNPEAKKLPGNPLADSYCQFCLQSQSPMIIQDARTDPLYANLLPASMGLTRYAGVPIMAPSGHLVGTLCILDDRSHEPLDDEDLRFLSLLAVRISYELDRENQLRSLEGDLAATEKALRGIQHRLIQNEKLAVTGMLSASISHDIRNILSAISTEMSIHADRPSELLKVIQSQLDRFAVLSHRLLSYAAPKEMSRAPVDVKNVLQSVLELLRGHLAVSGIMVDLSAPPHVPDVNGDPVRLEHLFVNLVLNAIQASKPGSPIRIAVEPHPNFVLVEVSDSGKGMTPHQLARLFEPFSSTRHEGFGLGLFSCRQIVEEIGGKISVVSQPNQGATFSIELPIAYEGHSDN